MRRTLQWLFILLFTFTLTLETLHPKACKSTSIEEPLCTDDGLPNIMHLFPDEVFAHIFSYLSFKQLVTCRSINKRCAAVIQYYSLLPLKFYHMLIRQRPINLSLYSAQCYQTSLRSWCTLAQLSQTLQPIEKIKCSLFSKILLFNIHFMISRANTVCYKTQHLTKKHDKKSASPCFSPNGRHFIIASKNFTVQIWELTQSGQWQAQTIITHSNIVCYIGYSPDSRFLVTASLDHTAQIWRYNHDETWQYNTTIRHNAPVTSVCFSSDCSTLLTASQDHTAQIWRTNTHERWQHKTTLQHDSWVIHAIFSPNRHYLLTTSFNGIVQIWSSNDNKEYDLQFTIEEQNYMKNSFFSPDSRYFTTISRYNILHIWELDTHASCQKKAEIQHDDLITCMHFNTHGHDVATASKNIAKIWTLNSNKEWEEQIVVKHSATVHRISFSPNGRYAMTNSHDNMTKIMTRQHGTWHMQDTLTHDSPVGYHYFHFTDNWLTLLRHKTIEMYKRDPCGKWQKKANVNYNVGTYYICMDPYERYIATILHNGTTRIQEMSFYHHLH